MPPPLTQDSKHIQPKIWWANAIFFILVHFGALVGIYYFPPWATSRATLSLWFATGQLSAFGITIGYHRLYSHKAFQATIGVRIVLAAFGSCAFQGSIKWWCLRHRLHHRFTDDPLHDPYAATRGLFFSHMGWIFYKPNYERMEFIERDDLDNDPVVCFQHKYYAPLALTLGFVIPTLLASLWHDPMGGFVWGGLIVRVCIWHCTFLVNSLAHWDGLQPYSDEDTSRGNLLLALLTGGEGNHNFHHAFPHDFRSGPSLMDWDPSGWIILALYKLGLVTSLRRARNGDLKEALEHMNRKETLGSVEVETDTWDGEVWNMGQVQEYVENLEKCVVMIDGFVVDVTSYLGDHPGGASLLQKYSIKSARGVDAWCDADRAYNGGLNNHSRAARQRMQELKVAYYSNTLDATGEFVDLH